MTRPRAVDESLKEASPALAGPSPQPTGGSGGATAVPGDSRTAEVDAKSPDEDEVVIDVRGGPARAHSRELLARFGDLDRGDPQWQQVRDELVCAHLPLVEHLARRFRHRGEPYDDLVQVGTIGLIKAIDRFDADRGVEFSTYATPTIVGEIKRYFRDKGWAVRVPRRLQELRLALSTATADLSQRLGRAPTVAELAERLGISQDQVLEGLASANAYATVSLEGVDSEGEEGVPMLDTLGEEDASLVGVDNRESLRPLLARLPARERAILRLRFVQNMTQSQIAAEIGISQMHVSRLLARTLAELREGLFDR